MTKKYYLINLLLILIIVFLIDKNYREWTRPLPPVKETAGSKQKTMLAVSSSPAGKKEMPDPAVFRSISDKNIFSPDRKEFPVAPVKPEIMKPPARPNLELFGVAVGPDFHSAMINNPTRRADRGERDVITVREGDRVGEYKVATITEDRIKLESSTDSFDVLLYDPAKRKKRPMAAPPTTPTPPTPTPPPVSTAPPRPSTPPAITRPPVITPPPGVVSSPTPPGGIPGRTMTRPQTPRTRIQAPPARTLPVPSTEAEDDSDDES